MRKITYLKTIALACSLFLFGSNISGQQSFGSNNLAVLVAAASANNTTVSVIELDKTTANQTPIQTIAIGSTGTDAIRVSGSATSTLYATNSNDGSLLLFTGHYSETTGVNANTLLTRAVIGINAAGVPSIKTTYTGTSGNQTRSATTIDNTNFYIADQGGQFTNSATSASPTGNFRAAKSFGGVVYLAQASTTAANTQVVTTSAITGGSVTGLPGLTNHASHQDYYLISSGINGAAFDVLYVLRASSNAVGAIDKYSLVEGSWVANGSYATTFGGFGLVAEKIGTGANLYLTTGQGALANNKVIKLNDAAGYNADINISTENNVELLTAPTGAILKGIAFAPKSSVPTSSASASIDTWTLKNKTLYFDAMPSTNIEVYSVTGSKVASFEPAMHVALNLSKGIYIVKVNKAVSKIILK